ncbi:amino acid/amide ABC transporter membrane protein 2, HAAT family /amino acid/amide ABC transporter ATP-binding protein 1, HAAT family [Rhizobiales bacterium GAS113]|nr:amino acid/amide ABC transporter membrane protein 2, HAAT family /amino acid/amide ABC transporter ATP-binding protein 1, HAAT family [Rhizobiales bacterium GAS113]
MRRDSLRASTIIAGLCALAGLAGAGLLFDYWIFLATSVLITAVALQSLGLVIGRTGMISLCQMSFAGVGAWTVAALNRAGFPGGLAVWILIGGLAAAPFGIAIGLPALRLRGINLAIVTLGFATAFDAVLATITFPGQTEFVAVERPELFASDTGYFLFTLIAYALIAISLEFLARSRLGAAFLSIRHSERAAAAHGVDIVAAKLIAFAVSAFLAGISGGLLAGYLGTLVSDNFNMMQSLVLFVTATMVGAQFAEGAVIGGLLVTLVPELLRRLGLAQDVGAVLFAFGATHALSAGESMSEALRRLLRRLSPASEETARSAGNALPIATRLRRQLAAQPLAIEALTVRYGNVVALDRVDLVVPRAGVIGLIGPNGAGKSTLVDAVTGFLPQYQGSVRADGVRLDGMAAHLRARTGIRRTWQTTRIAPDLSVGEYVRLAARDLATADVAAILDWLGCPRGDRPVASVDAGTRRLLDLAGVVAARPLVVLLDEPAAGQSYDEALRLGQRIAEIPERFGSSVLLVEHDMDLVRAACSAVTVLDFGCVIASGLTREVLDLPIVRKAYLGAELAMEEAMDGI